MFLILMCEFEVLSRNSWKSCVIIVRMLIKVTLWIKEIHKSADLVDRFRKSIKRILNIFFLVRNTKTNWQFQEINPSIFVHWMNLCEFCCEHNATCFSLSICCFSAHLNHSWVLSVILCACVCVNSLGMCPLNWSRSNNVYSLPLHAFRRISMVNLFVSNHRVPKWIMNEAIRWALTRVRFNVRNNLCSLLHLEL